MKYLSLVIVLLWSTSAFAVSGSETFVVVSKTDPGVLTAPNLLVHSMKQTPGMALDKGTGMKGEPIQSFIRDTSTSYSVTLVPQTITFTLTSYVKFQNIGSTSILIYRGGDITHPYECLAGTDCSEGIR